VGPWLERALAAVYYRTGLVSAAAGASASPPPRDAKSRLVALPVGDLDPHVEAEAEADLISQATVYELRDTSVEMFRRLHEVFADLLPDRLDAMDAAVRDDDTVELRRLAHLLAGSSAMLGASLLSQLCGQLERATVLPAIALHAQIARLAAVAAQTNAALLTHLA
jgi:HPt (histidine-containing phosphotransfer) domain-containing protein